MVFQILIHQPMLPPFAALSSKSSRYNPSMASNACKLLALTALPLVAQWANVPGGKVDLAAPTPRTRDRKPDLSGVWQTDLKYNTNLAADLPPDAVPMTLWGKALYDQRQANNAKDDPEGYCYPPGVPRASGVPFPEKIFQTQEAIVILYETRTMFRQIFLDGRAPVGDPQPTWMGYSAGHWDGDVLVVQTTGFNDRTWLDDDGHPHSENMRVTERFRRPDMGHLVIEITIDDPKAYERPWTAIEVFQLLAGADLLEYVCNENNLDPPHLVGK